MQRAMDETARRREKQVAYNQEHSITPIGIHKSVQDIMEGARRMPTKAKARDRKVAEDSLAYSTDVASLSPTALARRFADIEKQMQEHAKNLEFEEAAALRDQLAELKQQAFLQ